MSYWHFISYLLPLVAAVGVAALLIIIVWRRRRAPGAPALMALLAAAGLWSGAYVLELVSASLPTMIFWGNVGYLGIATLPAAWFVFALEYADHSDRLTRRRLVGLLLIPLLTVLFAWTNGLHGLMRQNVGVGIAGPYSVIAKEYGPWFWVDVSYSYLLLLLGTIVLLRRLSWRPHIYRQQSLALLVAIGLPWSVNILYLSGLSPLPRLDPTPIGFVLAGAALTWALVRYRLLDLIPIARVAVMETIDDGVMVFDREKRIVDLNRAAAEMIGRDEPAVVGRSVHEVFPDFSDLIEQCWSLSETYVDIRHGNPPRYYRLQMMALGGQHGQRAAGRVGMFRDITDWVQTTQALRKQELRFRSLVQNSSDVISILSSEGRVQYVSASIERILGYTIDEFVGTIVFDLVHPEDLPIVMETFTEVLDTAERHLSAQFRFQHGDGTWRVLEATGSNQLSNPAVGGIVVNTRDVTERVRAERAVRRRAEELAALHATSLDITQLDDLDRLLATIVERATDLLDAPSGGLYVCDPVQEVVHCMVSYNTPQDYTGTVLSYGQGAAGTVAETGEPLIIDDYRRWHSRADAFEEEQPFTAVVSAPMAWRDEVIGVVHVLHEADDRQFDSEDLELLSLFAEQAAIAVENARRLDAEQRAVRQHRHAPTSCANANGTCV